MRYFDIHTHRFSVHPEDIVVLNLSIGAEQDFPLWRMVDEASREGLSLRSYGIHPWYIYNAEEQMDELRDLASRPEVVAIGEVGLDKMAMTSLADQQIVFLKQVRLSEEVGKPLIIHCVKAWAELIACRKEANPRQPWIIHGFRGNGVLAAQLVRQGFRLSFGEHFQSLAVRAAWPDFLFAETDDKPIDIRIVYQKLSCSLSIPEAALRAQIEQNVRIFGINP